MAEEKLSDLEWMKMKPAELEEIIVKLAKEGNSSSKIGLVLRDKHAIPKAKLIGRKIAQIAKEKNIKIKTEKEFMEEKIKTLEAHILKHKKDNSSKRSLTKKLWAVKKL